MLQVDLHPNRISGQYCNKHEVVGDIEFDDLSVFIDDNVDNAFGVIVDITPHDDDEDSYVLIYMTPEEAEILADNLRNFAQIARGKEKEWLQDHHQG